MPPTSESRSTLYHAATDMKFYTRVLQSVALCGLLVALPFALYHLLWGSTLITVLLLPVIMLQSLSLYLLYRNGFNPHIALFLATLQMTVTTFLVVNLGVLASYWLYASGVANYFIVGRKPALLINVLACAIAAAFGFQDPEFIVRYIAAFAMINVFMYAFARQLEYKNRELDRMLSIDPLTRAGNRTALEEALRRVKSQFERYKTPAVVLMLDLDHFKQINDAHGHNEGDKVLKQLVELIRERLRATDSIYRFGGEEFVIITENTTLRQAAFLAEDIRQRIEINSPLTISIGLAELRSGESTDDLVSRADRALYRAKTMGRNWVSFDDDQDGNPSGMESTR